MTPRTARMRRKRRRRRGGCIRGQSIDSGIAPPHVCQHFFYQSSKRRYCTVLEEDDCVAVPSVGPVGHHQIVGELSTIRDVWSPCRKRKMIVTGWSARMSTAFVGAQGLAMMEYAAPSSYLVIRP